MVNSLDHLVYSRRVVLVPEKNHNNYVSESPNSEGESGAHAGGKTEQDNARATDKSA